MSVIAKGILATALTITLATGAQAQILRDYINDARKTVTDYSKPKSNSLTNTDIVGGLKQALTIGSQNATNKVSAVNGFFGNALIKILMPPEAKKVENTLRSIGMGAQVDNAIMAMNRAAEDASKKAVQIFINAITSMSITDGLSILKGGNGAATNYLKSRTTAQLTASFKPIIEESLEKVNATKYWSEVFTIYNRLPTTNTKINPDLAAYVTDRALSGVFVYVADEENKIRQNPAARVTDLLKKVFGQQ